MNTMFPGSEGHQIVCRDRRSNPVRQSREKGRGIKLMEKVKTGTIMFFRMFQNP
jgi:hypothetical protein